MRSASSTTSFVPQIVKILREREAQDVSLTMYLVTVTGFLLWTGYGLSVHSWQVVTSNLVCLLLSGVILALTLKYKPRS